MARLPARDDHSSATPVARRLQQPTRTAGSGHRSRFPRLRADPAPPLFGLAPGGVYRAVAVAGNAVRSYRTFSPLPRQNATHRGGLSLCGTVPKLAPAGRYPAPHVHGARTFLPHRLSALIRAAVRPTDLQEMAFEASGVKRLGRCLCRQGACRQQPLEGLVSRVVHDAVATRRPEVALERDHDLLGGLIIGSG